RDPNPASADLCETPSSHPHPAHRPYDRFVPPQDVQDAHPPHTADETVSPRAARDPNPASADFRETPSSHPHPAHRLCDKSVPPQDAQDVQDARLPRAVVLASALHPTDV